MKKFCWGLLIAIGIGLVAFLVVYYAPKKNTISQLSDELALKEQQQRKLQNDLRELERQIALLRKKDPAAVEAIARDKFGYCREGEEIYHIEMPRDEQ